MKTKAEIEEELAKVKVRHSHWVERYEKSGSEFALLQVHDYYGQMSALEWMLGLR